MFWTIYCNGHLVRSVTCPEFSTKSWGIVDTPHYQWKTQGDAQRWADYLNHWEKAIHGKNFYKIKPCLNKADGKAFQKLLKNLT